MVMKTPSKFVLKLAVLLSLCSLLGVFAQQSISTTTPQKDGSGKMKELLNQKLSKEELSIIEFKGTESPGTGEYDKFSEKGTYVCKRCNSPLYKSDSKFSSGCGWPSFDDEIEGRVKRSPDGDGRRTEILCAQCDGHLGHVFLGEKMTEKNTRHCVNSVSMRFIPGEGETGRAVFGGGCFWGVEYYFDKEKGVIKANSGYTGGSKAFPTYKEVCSSSTGHVEVVEVLYDPEETSYEDMTRLFFELHDPTQKNGQGPDIGSQYLSKIYYENKTQKETAEKIISELKGEGLDVCTELVPSEAFWPAEDYHQDYFEKKGTEPYCHKPR